MTHGRAIALFVLAMLPLPLLVQSGFLLNFVIMCMFFALLGQGWNILGGYGGQISFGHAAMFGVGAYTSSILQVTFGLNPWIGLAVACVAGAAFSAAIGFLSFRYGLRGSYFALITLAFAEVMRIFADSVPFTGGGAGMLIPLKQSAANLQFASKAGFYYLILALLVASLVVALWLERSRFGAWLIAVRENEEAARALGVNVFRCKLAAITISGAIMALGGTFYAQYFLYIDPQIAFGPSVSVEALLVAIIGGVGTIFGPLLGSVVLQSVGEISSRVMGDAVGINLVIYGVLLVLMVGFMPNGLFGMARVSARRLFGKRP
jgi:branched-chain amino acid transport system permease protein